MSIESKLSNKGKNDPLEFELSGEKRQQLKECWMVRFNAKGEGKNRFYNTPEVADVWLSAVTDFLVINGYEIKLKR